MQADFDEHGRCRVTDANGDCISEFDTACEWVYSRQYGTPFSKDGTRLFVGSWERGLFCYDVHSGRLLWRQGPGKVGTIVVLDALLVIQMRDRGIFERRIETGELVNEFKMTGMEDFFQLDQSEVFAGPKRNRYFVFRIPGLDVLHTIPSRSIDIHDCLSMAILGCRKEGNELLISGWEQYPNMEYRPDAAQTQFERAVRLDSNS